MNAFLHSLLHCPFHIPPKWAIVGYNICNILKIILKIKQRNLLSDSQKVKKVACEMQIREIFLNQKKVSKHRHLTLKNHRSF
jgi:hypothetical protein